jgi:inorganic pyrophosphatase
MNKNSATAINNLEAFDKKTKELNVIIETPKGSRNKYKFDEEKGLFKLSGILPLGASFPFDFGFIPNTLGEDGDPLDVLLLMDESAFPGCLVPSRLIGVIEADQTEDGKTERNDRLIAIACKSLIHDHIKTINDLNENLVEQIKHFFISYNEAKGKKFKPLGQFGTVKAKKLVADGIKLFAAQKKNAGQVKTQLKSK